MSSNKVPFQTTEPMKPWERRTYTLELARRQKIGMANQELLGPAEARACEDLWERGLKADVSVWYFNYLVDTEMWIEFGTPSFISSLQILEVSELLTPNPQMGILHAARPIWRTNISSAPNSLQQSTPNTFINGLAKNLRRGLKPLNGGPELMTAGTRLRVLVITCAHQETYIEQMISKRHSIRT